MPLREAVPKATSRRHFQARAFSPRTGPVVTIATIFNYRHARPEVFVPLEERRVGLPRRIGALKAHDLKSKILDGPGSVLRRRRKHSIKMLGTDCNCARCGQAPVINAPDMAHNDGPGHVPATGAVFMS